MYLPGSEPTTQQAEAAIQSRESVEEPGSDADDELRDLMTNCRLF